MVKFWENTAYYNILVECTEGYSIKKGEIKNIYKFAYIYIYIF